MEAMRVLYLAALLATLTSASRRYINDPHEIIGRSIWAGKLSYLTITTWAEPNCQGTANPNTVAVNQATVDLMPSGVKSYSLNRTLGTIEQLDFSAHYRAPALPSVATTTTPAPIAPPGGAGHVGPTVWSTDIADIAHSAECQLDFQESAMTAAHIAVPTCRNKRDVVPEPVKRDSRQCVNFVWTADDAGKDGRPGNCHTLPDNLEADCWNIWVH